MSDQVQNVKDSAASGAEQTKQFGEEKAGQAQGHAQNLGSATEQKAGEVQKEGGNVFQQVGGKIGDGFNAAKNAVSGK